MQPLLRCVLYGVFAVCAFGGVATMWTVVPSATAANDPCAASEIARTIGDVATDTGDYLDAHPQTNAALSVAARQSGSQAIAAMKTYFDANPQAGKDLKALQKPLQNLAGRCKLPFTLPQMLQMMHGAQQVGQLPSPVATPPVAPMATAPQGSGSAVSGLR